MQVKVDKVILTEVRDLFLENEISCKEKIRLRINPDEIFQWLIVGGGLVSIANVIITYKKLHRQTRKISINVKDKIIDVETQSMDELLLLLKEGQRLFITKTNSEEEE